MITVRPSEERGRARLDWLDSRFTFSFDQYYDPRHMGFRSLRVINDDIVAPGSGFPMHPHRDMEIITYMLEGALAHEDNMGHGDTISAGEMQHMTAGMGIFHSEFNPSDSQRTRLLQIWIRPREKGLKPRYTQQRIPDAEKQGRLRLVASGDGREGELKIEQDVALYASVLKPGQEVTHSLDAGRHAWVQVAWGALRVNGTPLVEGDGAAVSEELQLHIQADQEAEFLLFDLN